MSNSAGTSGDDRFVGDDDRDTFNGFNGNDRLDGQGGDDILSGGLGDDTLFGRDGDDTLRGDEGNDLLRGGAGLDFLVGGRGNDDLRGGGGNDTLDGGDGDDNLNGGGGSDIIEAGEGSDTINGGGGSDFIEGGEGQDFITTGGGRDTILINNNLINGIDTDLNSRQVTGGEDFITDFNLNKDTIQLDASEFAVIGELNFVNALAEDLPSGGANLIVLQNSDDDNDPNTAFNAGSAANLIAEQVTESGAGFFVYFNSGLGVNRLVYSEDLSDATADLQILTRFDDLNGQDAIDALANFSVDNFELINIIDAEALAGNDGDDTINGGDGVDTIDGGAGNDLIDGGRGNDILNGGTGSDTIDGDSGFDLIDGGEGQDFITTGLFGGDTVRFSDNQLDGIDADPNSRQVVGGEDFITDFGVNLNTVQLDTNAFDVVGDLSFINALAEDLPGGGVNVIVLQNSDDDNDPNTAFNAGSAANLIAEQITEPGAGFFVYFNSGLGVNRLVYSEDLSDATADLQIVARFDDARGQDAIDALPRIAERSFEFFSGFVANDDGVNETFFIGQDNFDNALGGPDVDLDVSFNPGRAATIIDDFNPETDQIVIAQEIIGVSEISNIDGPNDSFVNLGSIRSADREAGQSLFNLFSDDDINDAGGVGFYYDPNDDTVNVLTYSGTGSSNGLIADVVLEIDVNGEAEGLALIDALSPSNFVIQPEADFGL